jgi:hypothetical protein
MRPSPDMFTSSRRADSPLTAFNIGQALERELPPLDVATAPLVPEDPEQLKQQIQTRATQDLEPEG